MFFLLIYAATTSRTVTLGDTGEFLTAAAVGGVVHDPGYPLYTLFLHVVYSIPFFNNAFALNVTSAIFASVTLLVVYKISRLLSKSSMIALFSAGVLGTYEFYWFYAQVVQVHIFHVFLLSWLYYFLVKLVLTPKAGYLYAAGFVFGLGAVHSQTIIFTAPSFLMALFYVRKYLSIKMMLKLIPFGLVGLLTYLYIPWASSRNPLMNWGGVETFQQLLFIMFRGNYGTFNLTAHTVDAPYSYSSFFFYFASLFGTSWYILLVAAASVLLLKKRSKPYMILMLGFVLLGPFYYYLMDQRALTVTHLALMDQYIPYSFFFISIFAGLGAKIILDLLKLLKKAWTFALLTPFVLFPLLTNFYTVRLDNNDLLDKTTRLIFSELPQNAVILTGGDGLYFPGMYLQSVHNLRPDIAMVQLGQTSPWYIKQLNMRHPQVKNLLGNLKFDFEKACHDLSEKDMLYVYPWFTEFSTAFGKNCEVIPYGMVAKVVSKKAVPPMSKIKEFNDTEFAKFTGSVDYEKFKDGSTRTRQALFDIAEHINTRGLYYQKMKREDWAMEEYRLSSNVSKDEGYALSNEAAIYFYEGNYRKAIGLMEEAAKRTQLNPKVFYALGFSYGKIGNEKKAYENFLKFLDFEPVDDPQYRPILQFVNDYKAKNLLPKSSLTNF